MQRVQKDEDFETISKKAILNSMRKKEAKKYEEGEQTPAEKQVLESESYKRLQQKEKSVDKSIESIKESIRISGFQGKKQQIIRLADKR